MDNNRRKSRLLFGEPDMSFVSDTDSHIKLPLQSKGILYFVELKSAKYHGSNLGSRSLPALIDTGTSLIISPSDEFYKLYDALNDKYGSKLQVVQDMLAMYCSDVDKDDSISFNLRGT